MPVIGWLPLLILVVGIDEALKFLPSPGRAGARLPSKAPAGASRTLTQPAGGGGARVWLHPLANAAQGGVPAATAPIWNRRALWAHHTGWRWWWWSCWRRPGIGFLIVYGRQLFQLDMNAGRRAGQMGIVGFVIDKAAGRVRDVAAALAQAENL